GSANHSICRPSRLDTRDVRVVTNVRRDAVDAIALSDVQCGVRTAKSCGRGAPGLASSRQVTSLPATVTNKVMDTGESTKQPLKPLRRECRCSASPVVTTLVCFPTS